MFRGSCTLRVVYRIRSGLHAIREGVLSDAANEMKEVMRQEITPVLKRVQGVEVHAHTRQELKYWSRLAAPS